MTGNYKEHENWVRYNCLVQARKLNKSKDIDKIIKDAAKMADFVTASPQREVVYLSNVKKEPQ